MSPPGPGGGRLPWWRYAALVAAGWRQGSAGAFIVCVCGGAGVAGACVAPAPPSPLIVCAGRGRRGLYRPCPLLCVRAGVAGAFIAPAPYCVCGQGSPGPVSPKLVLYACHDWTILPLLLMLQPPHSQAPPTTPPTAAHGRRAARHTPHRQACAPRSGASLDPVRDPAASASGAAAGCTGQARRLTRVAVAGETRLERRVPCVARDEASPSLACVPAPSQPPLNSPRRSRLSICKHHAGPHTAPAAFCGAGLLRLGVLAPFAAGLKERG